MFFFRTPKTVYCVICGDPIGPKESRFADKNRQTGVERHRHLACGELDGQFVTVSKGLSPASEAKEATEKG